MQTPSISIIMNCYNGAAYLRETIQSVIDQTYSHWELIFWDNCSTDESAKIAHSFCDSRLKYFLAPEHTSLGKARAQALLKASGDYIAFLDVDDLFLPHTMETLLSETQKNAAVFSYAGYIVIDHEGQEKKRFLPRNQTGMLLSQLLVHYEVSFQTLFVNRASLINLRDPFHEGLFYSPDYNLIMRLAARYKACVVYDYLVKYRQHANSLSSKTRDRAGMENRITLDQLVSEFPEIKIKYAQQLQKAYDKSYYYDAVYLFLQGRRRAALVELRKAMFSYPQLILVWLWIFLYLPKRIILRFLNR